MIFQLSVSLPSTTLRAPPLRGHHRVSVFVRPIDDPSPSENTVMQQEVVLVVSITEYEPFLGREDILSP